MTTSPETRTEIETVFGDGGNVALPRPASASGEWRAFGRFVKNPALPDVITSPQSGLIATLRMLSLDLVFLLVFVAVLLALVAFGIELPENLNSTLELDAATILLIVIGAPVIEEVVFRGWLSGRPRYLIIFPILLVTGVIAAMQGVSKTGDAAQLGVGLTVFGGLAVSAIALFVLWKRAVPGWYQTIFPGAFWLSSAAFALVHFANYTEGALLVLLPLVLPQFVLGSMAAYLRVHYGLWTAIALHAAHNGIAIGIASLAMASETSA